MKKPILLEQLMRWFGPADPVSLHDIAQAGCTGVVSALHAVPVGDVWTRQAIQDYKDKIESSGLTWSVVESLPVHEDIKTKSGQCERYLENYKQSLINLGSCGIKVVTYNFMPVLDWVRTHVKYRLESGAETLYFNWSDYAIFDLFLLKRPGAEKDYSSEEITKLKIRFDNMDASVVEALKKTVLLSLPGSDIPFTTEQVLGMLKNYEHIDESVLKTHLIHFLETVAPVAEENSIQLAIHPDDPPFSVLGLPRVLKKSSDIADIVKAVPSKANGLCFCTGSFGARPDNDLVEMIRQWGSRVYFLHLRNTKRDNDGNFMEANHLEGDTDMYAVMEEVIHLMQREQRQIPMRPDHGYKILDDLKKHNYPGYGGIGRLKGLAELRGLEYAIQRTIMTK